MKFEIPEKLETEDFRLRILTPDDVEKDYEAVMTSIEHLRSTRPMHNQPNGWPSPQLTVARDLRDLKYHFDEYLKRSSFTYTVMSLDESVCLGCVYIYPSYVSGYDAKVRLWVRKSAYDKGLDPILFRTVKEWLAEDWPMRNPGFPGREIEWEKWNAMENDYLLRQASANWDIAFNAGNTERLMKLYAPDAISLPPNRPSLEGGPKISAEMKAFFADFDATHATEIVSLEVTGDKAVEYGTYTMTATPKEGGEGFSETGKHLVVRKKKNRKWLIVNEIWNLDTP